MKKVPLLITLGFFILIAGGITLYQYLSNKEKVSVWDLIPSQTVLLYEFDECKECVERDKVLSGLSDAIFLDFPDSTRETLQILSPHKKGNAVSVHVTSKDDFDVIYYFAADKEKLFESTLQRWKDKREWKYSERELNGAKIQEFLIKGKTLSCVQINGIWVSSFTPFLIEDVIRTFSSGERSEFVTRMMDVSALPKASGDLGNLYINLENFVNLIGVFPERNPIRNELGNVSLLDVKREENSFTLNGLSLAMKNKKSLLNYFENQSPIQFALKQYISGRTVIATNYGVSDGSALYKNLEISNNKSTRDSLVGLSQIDFVKLFESFGKELSLCYQESRNNSLSKVVLFETSKPDEWLDVFNQLSESSETEDTVFYEKYSTYEIREIEIHNLLGKLFAPLASGFNQTYYTSIGNTIILSEQLEEIKQFVDDIDEENVWGKSIPFNKFLESTLLESNVSTYINTPLAWNILANKLNPRWRKFISQNQSLLKSLELGAIQFSHLNESFYTNITWSYSGKATGTTGGKPTTKTERVVASLNSSIISKPFVLRSHVDQDNEVLVQDSLYNLYHFSSSGKVLWRVALDGPIIDGIKQIDFFNNGKLQFFFSTSRKMHVIDRLGNYVNPFPVEFKIKDLDFVSVVDYDGSKKYRFLLSDKSGKLWMYDKDMQNLDGWRPKNTENTLFAASRHHRIRGKDYLLAIRKDGWAWLMNRRGENLKGFPLNLDARPEGDYFLEIGNNLASTNFVLVSKDGFRIKFSLEGKVLSRETLVKPSFETQFSLIAEQRGKSYIMKRQDAKRLSILNEDGTEILFNDFVGKNPVQVQYYNFGAGKVYITITDLVQDVSFIYDGSGKLLTQTPVEGNSIELRAGKSDFPKTFVVDQNALIIQ